MIDINPWDVWLAILLLIIATFITRCGMLLLGERANLPPRVQDALKFAPACALAALIAPDVLAHNGQVLTTVADPKLLASVAAIVYFYWRKNMVETILFGMLIFTLLRFSF